KVPEDKTEFFHNKSIELTEAIAPNLRPINENDLKFHCESLKRTDAEITQTIHPRDQNQDIHTSYFMENTVSLNPCLKRSYKCIADPRTPRSVISSPNPKNPRDCPVDRKASMDMLHRILHQGLEDIPDIPELPKYDSLEESMEMTVAIPSLTNRSEITVPDLTENCNVVPSFGSGESVERHDNLEGISILNPKETFVEFDDKIQGNDIGATSVFLEQTPSFMYTSDLDLDGHVIRDSVLDLEHNDLEQQDLKQDLEQGIKQRDLKQYLEQQVLEQDRVQQDLEQGIKQRNFEQDLEQQDLAQI
ncbi:GSCOCG00004678001-RA-CDS, partial [Cotesia congregata]